MSRYNTEDMDIDEILEWSKQMGFSKSDNDKPARKKQWDTQSLNELLEPRKTSNGQDVKKEAVAVKEKMPQQTKQEEIKTKSKSVESVDLKSEKTAEKTTSTAESKAQDIPISKNQPKPVDNEKTQVVNSYKAKEKSADDKTKVINSTKASAIEPNKYRERFMNIPVQNIEKTEDYEDRFVREKHDPIERPGFVSWKNKGSATADLEPLPTIVPAEKVYNDEKTRITHFKTRPTDLPLAHRVAPIAHEEPEQDVIAGQIKLTGFEEKTVIERVDEAVEEQKLIASRKEKVKAFRLFKDLEDFPDEFEEASSKPQAEKEDEDEEEYEEITSWIDEDDDVVESFRHKNKNKAEIVHITDYNDPSDAKDILKGLHSKKIRAVVASAVMAVISILLYITEALPSKIGLDITDDLSGMIFCGVNLVLLIIAMIVAMPTISNGFKELFRGDPDADTACSLVMVVAFIQTGAGFFFTDSLKNGAFLYGVLAVFSLFLNYLGKLFISKRVYNNFRFITEKKATHSIKAIDNETSAFEIGRGLLMGEPDVRYSVPIKFPSKFIELSYKADPADKLSKKLLPIISGVAILIGIACGIIKKDIFGGISLAALSFILGAPCASLVATNFPLYRIGKALNKKGAMLSGYSAVKDCGQANAVVFDSSEIFAQGGCNILGIKTFQNMRIDEAILDAAAVVVEAGGPCGEVFDKVIEGRRELLPPVENLAYEDKLGLSAWIHGRRVLVGNRDLLINHNVEVPEKSSEDKYRHDGRQIMYLAVAGKLSALFVVGYKASADVGDSLRELDKNCVTILVKTSDANITEELISNFFGINKHAIKVISAVAGNMYKDLKKTPLETADAALLHDGKITSFLSAVSSAINLNSSIKIPSIIMIIASALSMLIAAVVGLFFDISHATVSGMLLITVLFDIFILISSLLNKK